MTAQRLEVSDDKVDLPLVSQVGQLCAASGSFPHRHQIAGDGAPVTDLIIYVGKSQAIDFRYLEALLKITQASIKRNHLKPVPPGLQMRQHFQGPGGMARTLAVHSIKYVGHKLSKYSAWLATACVL